MTKPIRVPLLSPTVRAGLGLLLPILIGAWLLTEIFTYSKNSLARHPQWISSKIFMEEPPFGAFDFLSTRRALARNQLDLGTWHGYQELTYAKQFEPGSVDLDFRLASDTFLDVTFNRDFTGGEGVRLSRGVSSRSFSFHADHEGRFTNVTTLPTPSDNRWHHLALRFSDAEAAADLDGVPLAKVPSLRKQRPFISFRAGQNEGVIVDNILLRDRAGHLVASEDFKNHQSYLDVFWQSAVALSVLALLVFFGLSRLLAEREAFFTALALQLVLIGAAGIFYAFDYGYFSTQYFMDGGLATTQWERIRIARLGDPGATAQAQARSGEIARDFPEIVSSLSKWDRKSRAASSDGWLLIFSDQQEKPLATSRHAPFAPKPPHTMRVGFVGTSQTYGEGAERVRDSFAGLLHETFAKRLRAGRHLQTFNFAIRGWDSGALLRNQQYGLAADLDLLVINLSSNDWNAPELAKNVREMTTASLQRGTQVL